ncbi:hypothetical protein [Amycolatopsis sp. CA-126428]|uniref:hypothetical protein n=1 Tax=Amycolatopsis sp. CA-126428 TaxID=2073158 RepID=UPI000CD00857|nr:hypothetical protein [Amycolatopsis sp. CA-126428]
MTDLREFRRACHEAARRTGGRIVEFRIADGVTPNFHQGVLDHGGHRVSIVCTRDRAEPAIEITRSRRRTQPFLRNANRLGRLPLIERDGPP